VEPDPTAVADAIALAKRDLVAGECLDGIGGDTCYGQIDTVECAHGCANPHSAQSHICSGYAGSGPGSSTAGK
jgi:predicted homoserine dehydrogenase-like protein